MHKVEFQVPETVDPFEIRIHREVDGRCVDFYESYAVPQPGDRIVMNNDRVVEVKYREFSVLYENVIKLYVEEVPA